MSFDGTQPAPHSPASKAAIPGVTYPSKNDMVIFGETCDGEGDDPCSQPNDPLRVHVDPQVGYYDPTQEGVFENDSMATSWRDMSPADLNRLIRVKKYEIKAALGLDLADEFEPSTDMVADAIEDGTPFEEVLDIARAEYDQYFKQKLELEQPHLVLIGADNDDGNVASPSPAVVGGTTLRPDPIKPKYSRKAHGLTGSTVNPEQGVGHDSHGKLRHWGCKVWRAEKKGRGVDTMARDKKKLPCDRRETIRRDH